MLKTGDGDTVLAKDIVAGSRGEAAVLNAIDFMSTNPYTAQALWDASRVSPLDGVDFAKGIKDAYLQGRVGTPYESIQPYSYAAKLTEAQRKTAWTEGRTALEQYTKAQAEKVNSGAMKAAQKGVTVTDSAQKVKSLNKQQKSAMAAANALAAVGLHIEVYASTPEDRAKGMPNGTYRKSDGGIAIDLNAGDGGQGAMAYALAHETTHFIKDFSAEKYKAYADLLIAEAQRQGIRYDSVFAREYDRVAHMEEYKGKIETELHDIAYDETIAEMSEMMLTDTDAIGRIAGKLKNQDKGLWEKIKDFFTGLVEKLRSAYQDAEPDSEIAKILKRAIKDNEALAEAWASAVVEAGENYQRQDGQKKNAREGERFSSRQYNEDAAKFEKAVEQWSRDGMESGVQFQLGSTGEVLQGLGAIESDIYMNGDKIRMILNDHPEITLNEIKQIPQILNDPALILKSRNIGRGKMQNTRMVLFGSVKGQNGLPVLTVFDLRPSENHFILNDMQKVTSAYTKTNDGPSFFESSFVLYADKKRATSLLRTIGFQMPIELLQSGFIGNITYNKQNVNMYGEKFSDVFRKGMELHSSRNTRDSVGNQLTEDQARYFENSRVRDEEGNLKVVYHGSPAIFTEFSADFMGTHGSSEGQGFYFTDYKPMAEGYQKDGGQLLQGYLNIQKPLSDSEVTLKRTEVRKLLHALDPTGDDLVLNYSG